MVPRLLSWIQNRGGGLIKLRPDQKLVAVRAWDGVVHRVKGVQDLMKELAALTE